ncbi:hypothetical protein SAMN05421890_4884 [Ensifer adhaerens]|nr:hypothetical protein SAMN05421890_4884 [Ensifer adhaerens]
MIQTLEELTGLMRQDGVVRIYAKKLAPNDNFQEPGLSGRRLFRLTLFPR